jgi:hypothetical protein
MINTETNAEHSALISAQPPITQPISHPTLLTYFEALNAGDFQAVANLFAIDGHLLPPFESAIEGREAIAAYLASEAKNMQSIPQTETQQVAQGEDTKVRVVGQVQSSLFVVNVGWQFSLNEQAKITSAKIKLLASLKDLLHLKP